jgi:hypothetical protein
MAIRRKTAARLASLSALGVGALGVGAGDAYANVVFSGSLNGHVGFQNSSLSHFTLRFGLAGIYGGSHTTANFKSQQMAFVTERSGTAKGGVRGVFFANNSKLHFGTSNTIGIHAFHDTVHKNYFARLRSSGAVWSSALNNRTSGLIASRSWHTQVGTRRGGGKARAFWGDAPSFTDQYVLFSFDSGSNTYFGWLDLSLSITKANGSNALYGPNLTINSFAYETTPDRFLPAGSDESVPEPATVELTGLAALALGAVGVRRWRAAKR